MRWRDLKSLAGRCVPGSGTVEIRRLGLGLVNETYQVLRDGHAYALRVAGADPHALGLDHAWEARLLDCAVRANLAPAVAYCDPQRGILLAHWVEGRSWTAAQARQPPNIVRLAELARRIHALPMPTAARVMNPAQWIDYYRAALARRGACTKTFAQSIVAVADRRLAQLAALPAALPVVCHSDLHALNLIDRGHSLVLLDWEYAHAADPLWDLAGWSANNDLADELQRDLLVNYYGRPATSHEWSRLKLLIWLYDYVCWLWSELYLNLRRGALTKSVSARALLIKTRLGGEP